MELKIDTSKRIILDRVKFTVLNIKTSKSIIFDWSKTHSNENINFEKYLFRTKNE